MLLHEQLCLFDTPILEALFVLAVYKCRAPSHVMQGLITACSAACFVIYAILQIMLLVVMQASRKICHRAVVHVSVSVGAFLQKHTRVTGYHTSE